MLKNGQQSEQIRLKLKKNQRSLDDIYIIFFFSSMMEQVTTFGSPGKPTQKKKISTWMADNI